MMAHWQKTLPPSVILDVEYEDVVADVNAQARRMLEHCGLQWDDVCLAFYEIQRTVSTASAAQVRRPIYDTSVGRWRPYQSSLQPLLQTLAVDPDDPFAAADAEAPHRQT
jgi:Sulfotransferase family